MAWSAWRFDAGLRLISAATGNARDKLLKPAANKPRHWLDYARLFCGTGSLSQ
jgi:hypothetical protein